MYALTSSLTFPNLVPIYGGIHYERLKNHGLQWPCTSWEHPGTPYLHNAEFTRGKGLFQSVEFILPNELPNKEYPFLLSTGRELYHYNSGTMTRKVKGLHAISPEVIAEIHPLDAEKRGIENGNVVKIVSWRDSNSFRTAIYSSESSGLLTPCPPWRSTWV